MRRANKGADKDVKVTTADQVTRDDDDAENEDVEATNKRQENMKSKFKQLTEENNPEIDIIQLLVDPLDPVQTVENFFDFSFLLKVPMKNKKPFEVS